MVGSSSSTRSAAKLSPLVAPPESLLPYGGGARTRNEDVVNKGGFSWKRAVGITNAERKVSCATGIPWTKSGRQRKVGSMFWKIFK